MDKKTSKEKPMMHIFNLFVSVVVESDAGDVYYNFHDARWELYGSGNVITHDFEWWYKGNKPYQY